MIFFYCNYAIISSSIFTSLLPSSGHLLPSPYRMYIWTVLNILKFPKGLDVKVILQKQTIKVGVPHLGGTKICSIFQVIPGDFLVMLRGRISSLTSRHKSNSQQGLVVSVEHSTFINITKMPHYGISISHFRCICDTIPKKEQSLHHISTIEFSLFASLWPLWMPLEYLKI